MRSTLMITLLALAACDDDDGTSADCQTESPPERAMDTAAVTDTGADTDPDTEIFDVEVEAFALFIASQGVTATTGGVETWTDVSGAHTLTRSPALDGIQHLGTPGDQSLQFDGTTHLEGMLGQRFTDATILVRFRYGAFPSDNDYLYSLGDGALNTPGGTVMTLSRGNFSSTGDFESYHYTGKDELLGDAIASDVWITSTQTFLGTPQAVGTSHHVLCLDGVDANMETSDVAYNVEGAFFVGNYPSGDFRLQEAEIKGIAVFDRLLTPTEIDAARSYMDAL